MPSPTSDPLLTVVVPCHNVSGKFNVAEGLRSLRDERVDVILLNDRSTDHTGRILADLKNRSSVDVRILDVNFQCPGSTRNFGIRQSRGRYVWMVDADDRIHPEPVVDRLSLLEEGVVDVVAFGMRQWQTPGLAFTPQFKLGTAWKDFVGLGRVFPNIIRKQFISYNNIFYTDHTSIFEDTIFILKLSHYVQTYERFADVIYDHVKSEGSVTRAESFSSRYLSRWRATKEIVQFVEANVPPDQQDRVYKALASYDVDHMWSYYIRHRKLIELGKVFPDVVSMFEDMGIGHHMDKFYSMGSKKSRVLKLVAGKLLPLLSSRSGGYERILRRCPPFPQGANAGG